jgi:hypothetical protein
MMSMIKRIALKSLVLTSSAFSQWNLRGLIIFRLFFVGALAFFFQTTTTLSAADEFDALRIKWRDTLIANGGTSIDSNALKYWTGSSPINLNPSSSAFYLWSDLPLNTGSSGNMRDTFDRLERMALAYANPSSSPSYYNNPALATAVINGLDWMVANVYDGTNIYDNWYHWMITGSENFANAALLVYPALSQAQITSYYTKIQYYGPSGGPGGLSLWPTS